MMIDMSTQAHGNIPELTLGWRLQMALGDMKVQDMADMLGVNRATIGRWMHDRGAPPRRAFVLQWAMATGVPAEWLESGTVPDNDGPDDGSVGQRWAPRGSNPEPTGSTNAQVIPLFKAA